MIIQSNLPHLPPPDLCQTADSTYYISRAILFMSASQSTTATVRISFRPGGNEPNYERIISEKTEAIPIKWHLRQKVTPKMPPELPSKNTWSAYLSSIRAVRVFVDFLQPLGATLCGKYLVQFSQQQNFIKCPPVRVSTTLNQSLTFLKNIQ